MSARKIVIYGTGVWGERALKNARKYQSVEVVGFADSNKTGDAYGHPILQLKNEMYQEFAVVIAIAAPKDVYSVYGRLRVLGYKDIYWFLNKTECYGDDYLGDECLKCGETFLNELPYAEMHLVDYCNLNCKGCTHFSPLFEKKKPDTEMRLRDVQSIKELFGKIHVFGLMGGEPLLNPDVERYIAQCRRIMPDTVLQVITNGLLLLKCKESILECIKQHNVMVIISEYAPTHKIINGIVERLRNHKIDYMIRGYDKKQEFCRPLSLKTNSIHRKKCISKGCVNIRDGKIAGCPTLMYIQKFNETFHLNLPTEGIYEIARLSERNEALVKKIYGAVPLCEYCVENIVKWEQCSGDPRVEDFANMD